jgi:hypothetical protein
MHRLQHEAVAAQHYDDVGLLNGNQIVVAAKHIQSLLGTFATRGNASKSFYGHRFSNIGFLMM